MLNGSRKEAPFDMFSSVTALRIPMLGIATAAVATEIGSNPKSLVVRPLTRPGDPDAMLGGQSVVIVAPDDQGFRNWRRMITAYGRAAFAGIAATQAESAVAKLPARQTAS